MTPEELLNYHPIYYTHGNYYEGGRKIHIRHDDSTKCLCGFDTETHLCNEVFLEKPYDNIIAYIQQPDPDKCICQRCKSILINKIIKDDESCHTNQKI